MLQPTLVIKVALPMTLKKLIFTLFLNDIMIIWFFKTSSYIFEKKKKLKLLPYFIKWFKMFYDLGDLRSYLISDLGVFYKIVKWRNCNNEFFVYIIQIPFFRAKMPSALSLSLTLVKMKRCKVKSVPIRLSKTVYCCCCGGQHLKAKLIRSSWFDI